MTPSSLKLKVAAPPRASDNRVVDQVELQDSAGVENPPGEPHIGSPSGMSSATQTRQPLACPNRCRSYKAHRDIAFAGLRERTRQG